MQDFVRNVMTLHDVAQHDNTPSAIFGTAGSLSRNLQQRDPIRIGLWPCNSADAPEAAQGIMTALLYLLDGWRNIRVYPLFVKAKATSWQASDSQFEVEDFEPENLDENVAIWGTLKQEDGQWVLMLEAENDMIDSDETTEHPYTAATLTDLINQLPQIAEDIAKALDAPTTTLETYDPIQADETAVQAFLKTLANWQGLLCLTLWENQWMDDTLVKAQQTLIETAKPLGEFGAWAVASAIAHSNLPGYDDSPTDDFEQTVIQTFPESTAPPILLARSILWYDVQGAYDIMEAAVEAHPSYPGVWLTLADLYRQGGRIMEMFDTFQRAIEVEATNALLYSNYATMLELISEEDMIEEYILIDPEEYYDAYPMWEAIAAYEEARKLNPDSTSLLQRQLLIRFDASEVLDDRLIADFKLLVERDKTGDELRPVAESIYLIDDVDPLLDIMEEAVEAEPNRVDLRVNMAVAYIAVDDYELAIEELNAADDLNEDEDREDEIARLLLAAEDPEFEARMGEIEAQVDGGATIGVDDIDFLENIVNRAPTLAEAYALLGKAYRSRDDDESALESLTDGYKNNPYFIDISLLLGQVLWDAGEEKAAFEYLNKGLEIDPNYVPLLATIGQFLFEDGQDDTAKVYLARAEAIAPRHPALGRARRTIAEIISGRN